MTRAEGERTGARIGSRIKVLVVDDSAIVRKILSETIAAQADMEVVGTAPDPFVARDKILSLQPDVLTLDIEMPRMDGVTFLKRLMHYHPMPVIVISSLGHSSCAASIEALRCGAVEVLAKPAGPYSIGELSASLTAKIRAAARARVCNLPTEAAADPLRPDAVKPDLTRQDLACQDRTRQGRTRSDLVRQDLVRQDLSRQDLTPPDLTRRDQNRRDLTRPDLTRPDLSRPGGARAAVVRVRSDAVIAIGASTGGTEAIRELLLQLPGDCPGIVITQHIPPVFSSAFAGRLNQICAMEVKEAADGDVLRPGRALVAPGDFHMLLRRDGAGYRVQVREGPQVCYQRPSVDVLFASVAEAAGSRATGALLTGMGSDGAQGLLRMKQAGARTVAQNEETCVVYGMPREAVRLGAADEVLPLAAIGQKLLRNLAPA